MTQISSTYPIIDQMMNEISLISYMLSSRYSAIKVNILKKSTLLLNIDTNVYGSII